MPCASEDEETKNYSSQIIICIPNLILILICRIIFHSNWIIDHLQFWSRQSWMIVRYFDRISLDRFNYNARKNKICFLWITYLQLIISNKIAQQLTAQSGDIAILGNIQKSIRHFPMRKAFFHASRNSWRLV